MSGQWSNGAFGCFNDCTICEKLLYIIIIIIYNYSYYTLYSNRYPSNPGLLSAFCPCIQFGRNAEQLGESCFTYALSQFVPILSLYCRTVVRGRVREQRGIDGSCLNDLLCVICLPWCSLAQESQVIDWR